MDKKGFELSVGMLVILIMSIIIFTMSVTLIFKWFGEAEEIQKEIDKKTQEQILSALKTGNQLVVIPFSVVEAERGKPATFGIGVRNIGAESDFSMAVDFSEAYAPDGSTIDKKTVDFIRKKWLGNFNTIPTFKLKRNQQVVKPLTIMADINSAQGVATPKGDYVFNVCVYNKPLRSDGTPDSECSIQSFKSNSKAFYTQKVYQVTVRVI